MPSFKKSLIVEQFQRNYLKITFIWMEEPKAILLFCSLINRFVSLNSMLYNLPPRGKRML